MNKILFSTSIFFLFLLCSCQNRNVEQGHENSVFDEDSSVPLDFMDFYMKFHADSVYQYDHIQFPLKGMPAMAIDLSQDSLNRFHWQKEDWSIHKPFMGNEDEFLKEFRVISNSLISEFIIEKQMGYGMERRFSKLGNKW